MRSLPATTSWTTSNHRFGISPWWPVVDRWSLPSIVGQFESNQVAWCHPRNMGDLMHWFDRILRGKGWVSQYHLSLSSLLMQQSHHCCHCCHHATIKLLSLLHHNNHIVIIIAMMWSTLVHCRLATDATINHCSIILVHCWCNNYIVVIIVIIVICRVLNHCWLATDATIKLLSYHCCCCHHWCNNHIDIMWSMPCLCCLAPYATIIVVSLLSFGER